MTHAHRVAGDASKIRPARRVLALAVTAIVITAGLGLAGPASTVAAAPPAETSTIPVGPTWVDTEGNPVAAHGGAANAYHEQDINVDVTGDGDLDDEVYLLYGENKSNATRPVDGVNAYWSTDLENWHNMGTVLPTHNVLPHKVVTIGQGDAESSYTDIDGITYEADRMITQTGAIVEYGSAQHPATTQKYTAVDPDALDELKRLANLSPEQAEAEGVSEDAASSKAFIAAYVTERDASGAATAYDEENLLVAFEYLYGMYNIVERPKLIYNQNTKKFVVIFHADSTSNTNSDRIAWIEGVLQSAEGRTGGRDYYFAGNTNTGSRYARAQAGFAVSDSPFGPFTLENSTRMNFDKAIHSTRFGEARDMTVFVDNGNDSNNDGVDDAYVVYSSEMNQWMYISLLNADYTAPIVEGDSEGESSTTWRSRVLPNTGREASAVFFWDGWYYMLTSGTDGWNSTPVVYYRAKSMLQDEPWERLGNPFTGSNPSRGYDSQPTYVLVKDQEAGQFIYMGDRWVTEASTGHSAGGRSKLIWLPITLTSNPAAPISVSGRESWDPFDATLYRSIALVDPLSVTTAEGDSATLSAQLPSNAEIAVGGADEPVQAAVTWDETSIDRAALFAGTATVEGAVTFEGDLAVYSGATVSATVTVEPAAARAGVELGGWITDTAPDETVTIEGTEVPVAWDPVSIALAAEASALTSTRLAGVATVDGVTTRVVGNVTAVPPGSTYVIDTGREGQSAAVLSTATEAGATLRNAGVADQKWDGIAADRSWGYSTSATAAPVAGTAADWGSSYVAANYNQPVTYRVTLPAGTYRIGTVQAPRSGISTKIYAKVSAGGEELARQSATSNGEGTQVVQTVEVEADGVVEIEYGTDGTSGYNARLALVWVAEVLPPLTVDAAVTPRCVAGKVQLAVTAKNTNDVPVAVDIATAHGSKSTAALQSGSSTSAAFATRSSAVPVGTATVTVDAEGRTATTEAPYSATTCG